jgi:hypothetical protein
MKRFSWREIALLSAPALLLLALPLAMKLRQPRNGIRVVAARTALPAPASVASGADVTAHLKLDETPNDNADIVWKVNRRLVAGTHLLWNDQKGDVERDVLKAASASSGAWYEWHGAFDLATVPTDWGEVALLWDAELTHTRMDWFRSYTEVSHKNGRIVLRRAGQQLAVPTVSRDPHLRLLRVEISPSKLTKVGALSYPIYPINLFFERDALSRATAPRISCDYKVRPHEGFMTFATTNGSDEVNRTDQDYGDKKAAARRYPIVEHTVEVEKASGLPGKSFVDWTIRHGDYWPMHVSIPFSDAKGRVLVGTRRFR